MKVWCKVLILLMLMVFIAGLGILLYPYLQGAITDYRIVQEAHEFLEMVETRPTQPEETIPEETEPPVTEPEETEPVLYPELLKAMQKTDSETKNWLTTTMSGWVSLWSRGKQWKLAPWAAGIAPVLTLPTMRTANSSRPNSTE